MGTVYARRLTFSSVWVVTRPSPPVTADAWQSQPAPSATEHLGCRRVADGESSERVSERFRCKWLVAHTGFEPVLPP